jgi:hypothetical protein
MLSPVSGRPKGAGELQSVSIRQDIFEFHNLMQPLKLKLRFGQRLCFEFFGGRFGQNQHLVNAETHIAE